MKTVEVVAAVIEKDGMILATQRGYGEFEGKWEFPGGKIKDGETLGESLKREIQEEMHSNIKILDELGTIEYDYPQFHLIMHNFLCNLIDDDLNMVYHDINHLEHLSYKWLNYDNLYDVDWLPADILVIDKLKYYNKCHK